MFEQRDILLVPVPYTDLTTTKQRPVLVLSSNDYNSSSRDIVVAAITSNIQASAPGPLLTSENMEHGVLPLASRIRADKIYTLSQSVVRKRYGRINTTAFHQFLTEFDQVLGRNPTRDRP